MPGSENLGELQEAGRGHAEGHGPLPFAVAAGPFLGDMTALARHGSGGWHESCNRVHREIQERGPYVEHWKSDLARDSWSLHCLILFI